MNAQKKEQKKEMIDITSLKVFFGAYKYIKECVKESIKSLDVEKLKEMFRVLIEGRNNGVDLIVDGQGRSLQSMLIMEDCLEHNGYSIIMPASNANLRPWKKGDIFFFNTGSGSGSPLKHAQIAEKDGLHVLGMTYNTDIGKEFKNPQKGVVVIEPSKSKSSLYAPLGTEFEFSTAVIGASIGYSVAETVDESLKQFYSCSDKILNLFDISIGYYEDNLDMLIQFINLINDYITPENKGRIYFLGVGRDSIINQVAAIRYGHLHKVVGGKEVKDLKVLYEGHWDLRKKNDLAILSSGSGTTSQTLNYATQAFVSGLRLFGITSFENSDLGRFAKRCNGCLVVPGRHNPFSMFNIVPEARASYLPEFELNMYLTMDALLAQIASDHGITEEDMRDSHRPKFLE